MKTGREIKERVDGKQEMDTVHPAVLYFILFFCAQRFSSSFSINLSHLLYKNKTKKNLESGCIE
jgi:hypothetical protein